jgi:hypothetical protein
MIMATKSYKIRLDLRPNKPVVDQARFQGRDQEIAATRKWLDDTREAFNAGVDYLAGWLLKMHRGTGVWREKRDGVWREWNEITSLAELKAARQRYTDAPDSFALLENHELLDVFRNKAKAEAVELAECCRRIVKEIAPPTEPGQQTQMNRSDVDLLTLEDSEARGVRPKSDTKSGAAKKTSGKRPGWCLEKAISENCERAASLVDLITRLKSCEEFQSAKRDGDKKIATLTTKHADRPWDEAKQAILERHKNGKPKWEVSKEKWEAKRQKSEVSGAVSAYRQLLAANCLPLPGFDRPCDRLKLQNCGAEWNYALWNMAGQRVRSHLGWVRRRSRERLLWELRTNLFEKGGWIRTKRNGKTIRKDDLAPDDFTRPLNEEAGEFEQRPGYSNRKWVQELRCYESHEMINHLDTVAFGAADQPRILMRTAKGWSKVRNKWIDLTHKMNNAGKSAPSADDLLDTFDCMRSRKTRDFGDRRLFEWLAAPERRWLWDGADKGDDNACGRDDRDCVTAFVAHNEHLADKPNSITFTRSDPVKHPVWPYFGENSAVEYWLASEDAHVPHARLVLVLKQLLARQSDGSYCPMDRVKIALRGYDDFEKSFTLLEGIGEVSAKQSLVFRDDLLGGKTSQGTLSGMKLTWERDELEASNRKQKSTRKPPRIYANFSCDAGDAALPAWLTQHVGSDVRLPKPRDGMTRAFFLKKGISKDGAGGNGGERLAPGKRNWPKEALANGLTVRGTDLGFRISSAGAWWRLSSTKPRGQVAWQVGTCDGKPVYAVLERTATVSLPGDAEDLPEQERVLRDRLNSLRTRLNLNNALLRIARLLTLNEVTQRKPAGDKTRKRTDGTTKKVGVRWKTETRSLSENEIKDNCRKGAVQLLRWACTHAVHESLNAIGQVDTLWNWLASQDASLQRLSGILPTTIVPTEKEAKEKHLDRAALKAQRDKEDDAFVQAVCELRAALAKALCDQHDAAKRRRAKAGLWFEFDSALMRELSYSDDGGGSQRTRFDAGLFRLLRKPPVTKHRDRKDEANNLPHGRTHRGGMSMSRLNFLDDVKNVVRRWSCRPRWPGDVRRVPEDAKFDRCDTEHLDKLREHRAKLIAHTDVAQTLGFEQDLRRGLWRFQGASEGMLWHRPERGHFYLENGDARIQCAPPAGLYEAECLHPRPAYAPAHVLVYEDLTRYKMSSDRPKNENAGLARWSHRRILQFAQHIGGLFGIPIATVDARFSSRYCSRCGAPGCRAVRFDPAWLNQSWMQRILQSSDIRDAAMKSVANAVRTTLADSSDALQSVENRPWVLRDGGTHFVCSNRGCTIHQAPIDADENAAANIGLRFLRGTDGLRATISASGIVARSIGFFPPDKILVVPDARETKPAEPYWIEQAKGQETRKRRGTSATVDHVQPAVLELSADSDDDATGGQVLFRDPSGCFRPRDRWYEGRVFWRGVAIAAACGISAANASAVGTEEAY